MSALIPLAIIAAIVVVGIVALRHRVSSGGGTGGNGGSRGRPGANKH